MPNCDSFSGPSGGCADAAMPRGNQESWPVLIRSGRITIGCQNHPFLEWWEFSDKEISAMHLEALAWWKQVKKPLFELLRALEVWTERTEEEDGWLDDWL